MANHMALIGCVLVAVAMLHGASADTEIVLDNKGWTVPTANGDADYRTWAASKDFEVGDILVFNFPTGAHDVAEVPKAGYDSCNGTNPITRETNGPANITLRTNGAHYFICTFPGHCQGGQKLAINVDTSSGTPTPSGPSPPRGPPPPSSASSIAVAGLFSALLSFAIAFLY